MRYKLIFIILVCLGLGRIAFNYLGFPSPRWQLGPLPHTFTFGNSLKTVRVVAIYGDDSKYDYEFKRGDWVYGERFGYFVRRDVLVAFHSMDPSYSRAVEFLRKKFVCPWDQFKQRPKFVDIYSRDFGGIEYKYITRVSCD